MVVLYSDEIDVYSIPHQRMKNVIWDFLGRINDIEYAKPNEIFVLLKSLTKAFLEFEIHEKIENECILKELQRKLAKLSIRNTKVCDCHKDSKLREMRKIFEAGYHLTSNKQFSEYKNKLKDALSEFTHNFIPHMEEEEQYFQPLLMTYFTYEELKQLKKIVMVRHSVEAFNLFAGLDDTTNISDLPYSAHAINTGNDLDSLPYELQINILQRLGPRDLGSLSKVSHKWRKMSRLPQLWTCITPIRWLKGDWTFMDYTNSLATDDFDENTDSTPLDLNSQTTVTKESKTLIGIVKYLLPEVGLYVKYLDLSYSRKLNNHFLKKILSLCPNLEHLDLSYTHIGDVAFAEFYSEKSSCPHLKCLNLTGCSNLTDMTLLYLARGITDINRCTELQNSNNDTNTSLNQPYQVRECSLEWLSLSGCCNITDRGLRFLARDHMFYPQSYAIISDPSSYIRMSKDFSNLNINNFPHPKNIIGDANNDMKIQPFLPPIYPIIITLPKLRYLDLSGIPLLTYGGLAYFLTFCGPELRPESLYYCDNVVSLQNAANNFNNNNDDDGNMTFVHNFLECFHKTLSTTTNNECKTKVKSSQTKFSIVSNAGDSKVSDTTIYRYETIINKVEEILAMANGCQNLECESRFCCRILT